MRWPRDLVDYDYAPTLAPEERAWLEAFTRLYYGAERAAEMRRDVFTAFVRVDGDVGALVEWPPYRSAFADARKRLKRRRSA